MLAIFTSVLVGCGGLPKSKPEMPVIRVQVVDEAGRPVKGVKATATRVEVAEDGRVMQALGEPRKVKASDSQGFLTLVGRDDLPGVGPLEWELGDGARKGFGYRVSLWGKNVLPTNVAARFSSFPRRIVVATPVDIFLQLDGKTVPGKPTLAPVTESVLALDKPAAKAFMLKKFSKNTWKARTKDGEEYVIGWLAGDKMFGYLSPPFKAERDKTLIFSPGMPATLEYSLADVPTEVNATPLRLELTKAGIGKKGVQKIAVPGGLRESDDSTTVTIKNLAGGSYDLKAVNTPKNGLDKVFPYLTDSRTVMLQPGIENVIAAAYPKRDVTSEPGDVVIRGVLLKAGGDVITTSTIQIRAFDAAGAMDTTTYYPDVKTDMKGRFEFVGVSPKFSYVVSAVDAAGASVQSPISSTMLEENKEIEVTLVQGVPKMEFRPRGQVDDLVLTLPDGKTGKLSDLRGKTVLLMLWGSWFEPSIEGLRKVNSFASIPRDRTDIVFLALNVDADQKIWHEALDRKDAPAMKHAWFDLRLNTVRMNEPLPFYALIDQYGVVRGTSPDFDIEAELLRMGYRPKPPAVATPEAKKEAK